MQVVGGQGPLLTPNPEKIVVYDRQFLHMRTLRGGGYLHWAGGVRG
jgi:hypothetical protein